MAADNAGKVAGAWLSFWHDGCMDYPGVKYRASG
jgi:hypothetical protein